MFMELLATVAVLLGQSTGTNEPLDYRETVNAYISHELPLGSPREFYAWGNLSYGQGYLVGQSVSDLFTASGGVGYEHGLTERINFRAEAGLAYPIHRTDHAIQQEVLYTYLVDRHAVDPSRPVPVTTLYPYDQESYESEFHIDYGTVLSVGLEFEVTEKVRVYAKYKYFHPKAVLEIWDEELSARGNGTGGWWQEYRSIDMSTFQLGIGWEF